ncbi:YafY family protein [Mesobacterium sp. TK19101]|uniref:YafY family protein n=1 Tax=Mesobacterium hydrothermale TaxID=3111907 RepID=A0ABU6HGU0_9RHOB|nr:YafY family protein [Mesobacterium sp. TK19101]MEC3861679.1 YafY family protein [Mesobacterium sp. TK19101]
MSRSDRLFDLIQILRDGKLHRAEDLARTLGVSIRTVYRDMDTLAASGVPVEGARGAGYMATSAVTLPPLNLTLAELEALHISIAVLGQSQDAELQKAAASLSAKIEAVLPEDTAANRGSFGFSVYPFDRAAQGFRHMPTIRAAIRVRQKLELDYLGQDGARFRRIVRPLHMDYWGRLWTLTAWCETTQTFQVFRVDRIETLRVLPGLFVDEPGKTLKDYQSGQQP